MIPAARTGALRAPWLNADTAQTWAHRFTLLSMIVYIGRISDILPQIGAFQLGKILIGLALIAMALESRSSFKGIADKPIMRAFLWMFGIAIVTAPFGIWRSNSVAYIVGNFAKDVLFVFLLVATTRTLADVRRAIAMYAVSVLILCYVILTYGPFDIQRFILGRNEIAMVAAMTVGLLLPLELHGIKRVLKIAAIIVMSVAILKSESRGGYLGLAVVYVSYLYLHAGKRVAVTVLLTLVLGYVTYLQLPSDVTGRIETIVNYQQDYNLTAPEGRIAVWKRGLTMIAEHPITGVGIGNFPIAEGWMHIDVKGEPWMNAHNAFIQAAAEMGLGGLAIFIALLVRTGRGIRAIYRDSNREARVLGEALLLSFVAYMVTEFFLSAAYVSIFFALMGMVVAAQKVAGIAEPAPASRHFPVRPRRPAVKQGGAS